MSHTQQTCPLCGWERLVRVPQTADREFDELIARHVGRSLQWEWQVHMKDRHAPLAAAYECLTPGAFDDWVQQEGACVVLQETPPSEGGGKTVGVNLPVITPEQAKALAEAMEHVITSATQGIQRFAETMVPALHSAQEQLTDGLRAIVEQHPGRRLGCACNGGQGDHQPGQEGCLFRPIPAEQVSLTRRFWENLYGPVPQGVVQVQRDLSQGLPGDRPYGTVDAEICSNCQRLAGEPHAQATCLELS